MATTPFGFLRVGAASPRLKVAEPELNGTEILACCRRAAGQGVQVLVFPELALTGYTVADLLFSRSPLLLDLGSRRAAANRIGRQRLAELLRQNGRR